MNHPTDKDAICWNLLQAGTLARKQLQDIAEEYSLTSTLLYALCSLSPKIPASMREISDALICDASNVTGLVDRLMHHGLVERHESADDRRVKEVSLTEKGLTLRTEVFKQLAVAPVEGLDQLSPGERALFGELLAKMLRKA